MDLENFENDFFSGNFLTRTLKKSTFIKKIFYWEYFKNIPKK
jgi:hypothetical protein